MPYGDVDFDWSRHGLQPRWLGMETSDCAAALDPINYYNGGAEEQKRFFAGARARGETALVICTMGDAADTQPRRLGATADATIWIPDEDTAISGARLPSGAAVTLAENVTGIDRDLGLRLKNGNSEGVWWAIARTGAVWESGSGGPATVFQPSGRLDSILVDGLQQPVVAVWTPDDRDERWYIIPHGCDYHSILDWLLTRALAEHVPGALRRARSPLALDQTLQTPAEATARAAIEALEAGYATQRASLDLQLEHAIAEAGPIREGLLFGASAVLENAVQAVLEAAGLRATRIDDLLSGTASADLLVSSDGENVLVEIKSSAGNAGEELVARLENHLRTWPQLQPASSVVGGVLVVNHQTRLDPAERSSAAYERPEFVESLPFPVITTRQLFDWWRNSDWSAITHAFFPASANRDSRPINSASVMPTPARAIDPEANSDPPKRLDKPKRFNWKR